MSGAWLFVGALLATLAWALWESGLDGWALLLRLILFVPLGLLLFVASIRRAAAAHPGSRLARMNAAYAAALGLLVLAGVALFGFDGTQEFWRRMESRASAHTSRRMSSVYYG
jgi:quinoprotein glucose dehydrogenase